MPAILIGLGGCGVGIVRRVKRSILQNPQYKEQVDKVMYFVGVDIQPDYDAEIQAIDMVRDFELRTPAQVIHANKDDPEFSEWWPKDYVVSTPLEGVSAGGQIRISGRLCLFHNFEKVSRKIQETIREAKATSAQLSDLKPVEARVNVFIISSLGGGTGSGIIADIGCLVKSSLDPEDKLYAVLLDGTVTTRFAGKQTELYGFAGLTELEHWMVKGRQFKMKYSQGQLLDSSGSQKFSDNLFDIIWLVQSDNMDGRTFSGSGGRISKHYKDLASAFLETVMTSREFAMTTVANDWNRFDIPHTYNGRSYNYASFAVSYISFPIDKVADYCASKYVAEELSQGTTIELPDVDKFEQDLEIDEWDGDKLTDVMRGLEEYTPIVKKRNALKERLEDARNPKEFNEEFSDSDLTDFISWDSIFQKYEEKLGEKIRIITDTVARKIESIVFEGIISLQSDELLVWLDRFSGILQKNIGHVEKYKRGLWETRSSNREGLVKLANAVIASKSRGFRANYVLRKNEFMDRGLVDWYQSELAYREYPVIKEFYDNLLRIVESLRWSVEFLKRRFEDVLSDYQIELGKYASHKWLIDPERSRQRDYVLEMDMSVQRDVVDREIYPKVREMLKQEDILSVIGAGDKQNKIRGIKEFLKELHKADKEELDKILMSKQSEIKSAIKQLMSISIREKAREKIKEFSIGDAIEWFLDGCFKDFNAASKDAEKLNEIESRFELIFGSEACKALTTAEFKEPEDWKNTAAASLISRMLEITKPFVKIDEGKANKLREEHGIWKTVGTDKIKFEKVFAPRGFKYGKLIKGADVIESSIPWRMTFYAQHGFFPLLTLSSLKESARTYMTHIAICDREGKVLSPPIHADARFYKKWKDDIMQEREITEQVEDLCQSLLVLGFGLDLIKREKSIFYIGSEEEKIKIRGLLKAKERLTQDKYLRTNFRTIVYRRYEDKWIGSKRDFRVIQEVFKKAYKDLKRWKPPESDASRPLWNELCNRCKFGMDGKPSGSDIPKGDADVEILRQLLEQNL